MTSQAEPSGPPPVLLAEAAAERPPAVAAAPTSLDHWLERVSDHLSPMLVKEARQAIKSRQFTVSFSLLLVAAWVWSLFGPMMMAEGGQTPMGRGIFMGYYVILAIALVVFVPAGAMRSLSAEQEDNTFELIALTTLRGRQIVSGKLACAALQMIVYLSALLPCLAFTYLLRGLDVPTIVMAAAFLAIVSLGLSMVGILLASMGGERSGRAAGSVLFLLGLLFVLYMAIGAGAMVLFGGFVDLYDPQFWYAVLIFMANACGLFLMAYYAAAARLTFAAENRVFHLRLAMMLEYAILMASVAPLRFLQNPNTEELAFMALAGCLFWFLCGAAMTGETPELSLRARRRLPRSLLGRALGIWYTPGPATGYTLAVAGAVSNAVIVAMLEVARQSLRHALRTPPASTPLLPIRIPLFAATLAAYTAFYLGLGWLLLRGLRRISPLGPLLAAIIQLLLVAAGAMIPFGIASATYRYNTGDNYSLLQLTNVFWTGHYIVSSVFFQYDYIMVLVAILGVVVFALNLPAILTRVREMPIALPQRVVEEDAQLAQKSNHEQ